MNNFNYSIFTNQVDQVDQIHLPIKCQQIDQSISLENDLPKNETLINLDNDSLKNGQLINLDNDLPKNGQLINLDNDSLKNGQLINLENDLPKNRQLINLEDNLLLNHKYIIDNKSNPLINSNIQLNDMNARQINEEIIIDNNLPNNLEDNSNNQANLINVKTDSIGIKKRRTTNQNNDNNLDQNNQIMNNINQLILQTSQTLNPDNLEIFQFISIKLLSEFKFKYLINNPHLLQIAYWLKTNYEFFEIKNQPDSKQFRVRVKEIIENCPFNIDKNKQIFGRIMKSIFGKLKCSLYANKGCPNNYDKCYVKLRKIGQ